MDWVEIAFDFFNNASVSAFLGAASAFLLVYFNDLRRKYIRHRTLRETLSSSRAARYDLTTSMQEPNVKSAVLKRWATRGIE